MRKETELEQILAEHIDFTTCSVAEYHSHRKRQAKAHWELGLLCEMRNELDESLLHFLQAAALDPNDKEICKSFANALRYAEFKAHDDHVERLLFHTLHQEDIDPQAVAYACASMIKNSPMNVWENALLLALMNRTIIPHPFVEDTLTQMRRDLLLHPDRTEAWDAFVLALKTQCRLTQFIYQVSPEETTRLSAQEVSENLRECYESQGNAYAHIPIDSFGLIHDLISQRVQEQYEEHPYPLWETLPPLELDVYPHRDFDRILVAGCGTGRHALMVAKAFPETLITAIDLSYRSLQYAKGKAQEFGMPNIVFWQGDLLQIKELNQSYDLIECTGVLHHMANPLEGWQALVDCLEPNGWMHIGLYSALARKDVLAARELIAEKGWQPIPEDIRKARQFIRSLPEAHTAKSVIHSVDFYSMAGCRDFLFHTQEHQFRLLEIKKMLAKLGLIFERFTGLDPWIKPLSTLEEWDAWEQQNPDTFVKMYQFWARKRL